MTIASALVAAQGRVADCYTSVNTMGGTLPATQNLTNLPAAIESIPQGGGNTIYATNNTGSTPSAGDKVILNLGANTSLFTEYNEIVANSASNYLPQNSFSAFVTGNVDGSGKYEVATFLPETAEVNIVADLEADEFEFLGGVE